MNQAYVVSTVRTPVGKAYKGSFAKTRPDDLAAVAMREAIKRVPGLKDEDIDDIIMGCAMPEGEQGMNVARIAQMRAGIPPQITAMTVNRFCASGLQAIAQGMESVKLGNADVILAGGTETMTMIPMGGNKISPNPHLADHYPQIYISMGVTAEKVADRWKISREDQDAFSYNSQMKAVKAQQEGKFDEEIVPVTVTTTVGGKGFETKSTEVVVTADDGPRADTTLEGLAKLKPAFRPNGSVTAGNSSQMSDGAAATVVMSETKIKELGVTPMARFVDYVVAGCDPDVMGIGPAFSIPKLLKKTGMKMNDIGLFELNEAFAAQSVMVLRELDMDPSIVNVNGGAVALGHPLGCTGAKLTSTLLYEMKRRGVRYGVVAMCIGGGMGAAGLFELVN